MKRHGKIQNLSDFVRAKEASKKRDREALESGEKSREQLRRENGYFAFKNAVIHYV